MVMGNVNYNGANNVPVGDSSAMSFSDQQNYPQSDTGDIIIAQDKPKNTHKKGLVIGGIILTLIAFASTIATIVVLNRPPLETAHDKFNKLLNFVISGKESSSDVSIADDSSAEYYFNQQQKSLNNREALYAKTSELLNDFLKSYNEEPDKTSFSSNPAEFQKYINECQDILKFSIDIRQKQIPDIYSIIDTALSDNFDNTQQDLINYYNYDDNNHYSASFKEAYQKYINTELALVKQLDDKGCLIGNTIDRTCAESTISASPETNETIKSLNANYDLKNSFTRHLTNAHNLMQSSSAIIINWRLYA